jgi:hypothetical protein
MAKDQLRPIGDASCNFPRHRLNAQPRDGRHSRMRPASLQIAATLDRLVSRELSMSNAIAKSVGFSEILVATDFSRQADYALEVAKSIARESKGELLLVHVSQPARFQREDGWMSRLYCSRRKMRLRLQAQYSGKKASGRRPCVATGA